MNLLNQYVNVTGGDYDGARGYVEQVAGIHALVAFDPVGLHAEWLLCEHLTVIRHAA